MLASTVMCARVVVLERAPEAECGGNSAFTGGATRFAFRNVDEVREVLDLTEEEVVNTEVAAQKTTEASEYTAGYGVLGQSIVR